MFKSRLNNLSRRNTLFDHLFVDVDVLAVLVPAAQHPFLGRHPAVPEDVLQTARRGHRLVARLGGGIRRVSYVWRVERSERGFREREGEWREGLSLCLTAPTLSSRCSSSVRSSFSYSITSIRLS